jgi:DNA-binding MarR family transcriptional regulator
VNYFGTTEQRLLLESPLSKSEKRVLVSLVDLQGCNLYRVCRSLDFPPSTIKLAVKRMVSKNILTRTKFGIFLTPIGKKLCSSISQFEKNNGGNLNE